MFVVIVGGLINELFHIPQVFLDKVKTSKRRLELGLASSSLPLGIRNGWGILKPGRNKRLEKERESVCLSTRECVCVITRVCVFVCVFERAVSWLF